MGTAPQKARRLSPATVVDTAVELIASDGIDALSMRKLAQSCGVGAMTLYGYFRTKEELLTAIAERLFAEVEPPDATSGWQDQIREIFRCVHRIFMQHPELADIVSRQHLNATAAFRGAEFAFAALERAGLNLDDAMNAFVALAAFTAGFSQRQSHIARNPSHAAQRLIKLAALPSTQFGRVSQLTADFATELNDQRFEAGLDLLVRGIAAKVETP